MEKLQYFKMQKIMVQIITSVLSNVRWVPCHHGMASPQVEDGEDSLQIWMIAVNILNNQPREADKGWSSSLVVVRGANNSSH
jgi:hypothetical protein